MQQTTACVGFFVGSGVLPKVISSSCCSALIATEYSKAMHCLALLSCVIAVKAPLTFWHYAGYRLFQHDTTFLDQHRLKKSMHCQWPTGVKWSNPPQQHQGGNNNHNN